MDISDSSLDNFELEVYKRNLRLRMLLLGLDFEIIGNNYLQNSEFVLSNRYSPIDCNQFLQISIVSKIQMLIEDFIVISKSILEGKRILDILNRSENLGDDAGKFIRRMTQDAKNFLKQDEILKIMSWTKIDEMQFGNNEEKYAMETYLNLSYRNISASFSEIAAFSLDNHIVLKRFKHGGSPIYFFDESVYGFDHLTIVSDEDNLKSICAIPFRPDVFQDYENFSNRLSAIILEIVENKQIKNKIQNPMIFPTIDKIKKEIPNNELLNEYLNNRSTIDMLDMPSDFIKRTCDTDSILSTSQKWKYYKKFIEY